MPGTLFVVATPIGNLEDITLRALRVLREVAVVAAEDTRRTGNLLRHYGIHTPLVSLHAHNERKRALELIRRLQAGESVALATDAGTPGISDPGGEFVRAARTHEVRVEPVPGPSAITAILSASGLEIRRFAFAGFCPVRSKDRSSWFTWVCSLRAEPVVFFEAPHRIRETIAALGQKCGDRPILLARELTKLHETWLEGSAEEILQKIGEPQGEYVGVLAPTTAEDAIAEVTDRQIWDYFGRLTENSASGRREAIRLTASHFGKPSREVFQALERRKFLVNDL